MRLLDIEKHIHKELDAIRPGITYTRQSHTRSGAIFIGDHVQVLVPCRVQTNVFLPTKHLPLHKETVTQISAVFHRRYARTLKCFKRREMSNMPPRFELCFVLILELDT